MRLARALDPADGFVGAERRRRRRAELGFCGILLSGDERGMPSTEGIPMLTNELIASLLVGVTVTFIVALAWGHQISDLVLALD